jgi:hypothetical protein
MNSVVNSFVQHHQSLIRFGYSCFDRITCSGYLRQFQHAERAGTMVWFLRSQRHAEQLNRAYFASIAANYHVWLADFARQSGVAIVEPEPEVRREDWVEPYYQQLGQRCGIAVILKCREAERMTVHFAKTNRIGMERRWVNLYYFYLNDPRCGRMFVRLCPYFPFNLRLWMNGHHWLARRLDEEGIAYQRRDNLFVECARPERLQELADAFGPHDIATAADSWLPQLLPFFSASERQQGYCHQWFMTQMEYCHNLVFHQRRSLTQLFDRLLDANRSLGRPDKLAIFFGRPRFRADTRTGQTSVRISRLRLPVISSSFHKTSIKQYTSHQSALRTESTVYHLPDLKVNKALVNLPKVRAILATANERYLTAQQDILATYLDRGQLQQLRQPTVSPTGRRTPGLRLDDARLLALCQVLTCFVYLAGKGSFRTTDLLLDMQTVLDKPDYKLSQLRYDLAKLRCKGLVERLKGTHTYRLTSVGYRLALLYLKLYQRFYAPLTAGLRDPVPDDNLILSHRQTKLDRLYTAVSQALHRLVAHLGLAA